jgi:hypothetical protein
VKAIANCVLTASGYTVPSREEALAREAWLDRRGDLSSGKVLAGMTTVTGKDFVDVFRELFGGYRLTSAEEQAFARLERQRIEIITGEAVSVAEASWLVDRIGRNGSLGGNERALIEMLRESGPILHRDLADLDTKLPIAA